LRRYTVAGEIELSLRCGIVTKLLVPQELSIYFRERPGARAVNSLRKQSGADY
jgi:hypothetical protein